MFRCRILRVFFLCLALFTASIASAAGYSADVVTTGKWHDPIQNVGLFLSVGPANGAPSAAQHDPNRPDG